MVSNDDFAIYNQYSTQLSNINAQKTQIRMLQDSTKNAIEELKQSKEDHAFKNLGFVLLKVEKSKLIKDLEAEIETLNIRLKTLERSEDVITKKLKELQAKLDAEMAKQNTKKEE